MIYTANRTQQTNTYLNHNQKYHDESSTILDTTDTEE